MERKIIAVDFDGTLCMNQDVDNDNIEATKIFFGGNSRKICCDYYIDDKGCTPDIFYNYLDK